MSAAHTPGPWEVLRVEGVLAIMPDPIAGRSDTFLGIATVQEHDGERNPDRVEANARLLAAAPDLLGALLGCIPQLELGNGEAAHIKAAHAAIAKATNQPADDPRNEGAGH